MPNLSKRKSSERGSKTTLTSGLQGNNISEPSKKKPRKKKPTLPKDDGQPPGGSWKSFDALAPQIRAGWWAARWIDQAYKGPKKPALEASLAWGEAKRKEKDRLKDEGWWTKGFGDKNIEPIEIDHPDWEEKEKQFHRWVCYGEAADFYDCMSENYEREIE